MSEPTPPTTGAESPPLIEAVMAVVNAALPADYRAFLMIYPHREDPHEKVDVTMGCSDDHRARVVSMVASAADNIARQSEGLDTCRTLLLKLILSLFMALEKKFEGRDGFVRRAAVCQVPAWHNAIQQSGAGYTPFLEWLHDQSPTDLVEIYTQALNLHGSLIV